MSIEIDKSILSKFAGDLRPLTHTDHHEAHSMLLDGHDPVVVAMKFMAPFASVARIANSILRARSGITGIEHGSIPEDLPTYLQLVVALGEAREEIEKVQGTQVRVVTPKDVSSPDDTLPDAITAGN